MTSDIPLGQLGECRTCFQPEQQLRRRGRTGSGCPLLAQAAQGEVPPQWKRSDAESPYTCDDFTAQPPVYRRPRAKATGEQGPLFDEPERQQRRLAPLPLREEALFLVEPSRQERRLVPVDGWRDYRAEARGAAKPPGVV